MREIHFGQVRLSQLASSPETQRFGVDDISTVLDSHKNTLMAEIESCSRAFDVILLDIVRTDSRDDNTGTVMCQYRLTLAAQVICWLRLVAIILNPPPSTWKLDLINQFASMGQTTAQHYVAKHIASKTASLAKRLLSSRSWTDKIPEQSLWEGTLHQRV